MKKEWHGYLFIAPLLLGCLVFTGIPFVLVMRYSVFQGAGVRMRFVGLENYAQAFQNSSFVLAFGNSMRFLAAGLPLVMAAAYLTALLLKSQAKKYSLLKSVLLFPYIMPVAATVLLVEGIFGEAGGLNWLLSVLGLSGVNWLDGPLGFWVAVLLYLWKSTGYAVILLLAGLVTIPEEQYESAQLDGASAFQKFRYITTPQMWYPVFFALIFSLINAFKCFREIFLIGGQHPSDSLYMLQHFINNSFENLNYANLSVSSILLLAVILLFFGVFYGFVSRKERYRE